MKLTTKLLTGSLATAAFFAGYATSPDKPAPTTHDSQAKACWYELKTAGDSEQICGKVSLAPDNAYNFSVYTDTYLDSPTTAKESAWTTTTSTSTEISSSVRRVKQTAMKTSVPRHTHASETTMTTLQTIPQQLVDRIPDSDAELAYCKAINQPVGQCQMPEHKGMGEQ